VTSLLNAVVQPSERITRFGFERKHIDPLTLRAKPPLFKKDRRGEVSVMRISGLDESAVWDIAKNHVEPTRGIPAIARADLSAAVPMEWGLQVTPAPPPPEHACIVGWPENDSEEARAKELNIRHRLAEVCRVFPRPPL
jgi:hypothetical protein